MSVLAGLSVQRLVRSLSALPLLWVFRGSQPPSPRTTPAVRTRVCAATLTAFPRISIQLIACAAHVQVAWEGR